MRKRAKKSVSFVPNLKDKILSPAKAKRKFGPWPLTVVISLIVIFLFGSIYLLLNSFQNKISLKLKQPASIPGEEEIFQGGKIIIGTDATYPPMEFSDDSGNLVGYDIDLGNKLAEELEIKAEFVIYTWDDLFSALEQGKIDLIISSVTINDERKLKYDFSDPYLNAGQVIITRNEETKIKSTNDLQGKKIGVQKGTTNEQEARKYTAENLVLTYDDFIAATDALLKGKLDAIFSDLTNAKGIVNEHRELKIASDPFTSDFYGIVFRKNDLDHLRKINTALNTLRQRGVLVLLKQRWLD